jgi:hypothetical protein
MPIKCAACFRLLDAYLRHEFFIVIPHDAIVNQCWDSHGKGLRVGILLIAMLFLESNRGAVCLVHKNAHQIYLSLYKIKFIN